jgi:hypothetical protein
VRQPPALRGVTVDASLWPLVIVTFAPAVSDDQWRVMFRDYAPLYARREKFHVVNNEMTLGIGASQRRLIAAESRAVEELTRRWCLGGAVVSTSPFTRGILTALGWIAPPAFKLTVHANLPDAIDEAFATFKKNAIQIPKSALAYRASLDTSSGRALEVTDRT